MKAIFIAFDEAYYDRIVDKLHLLNCRGFTGWREVQGRGSKNGEPHYATHAWPSIASAILTVVDDRHSQGLPRHRGRPCIYIRVDPARMRLCMKPCYAREIKRNCFLIKYVHNNAGSGKTIH